MPEHHAVLSPSASHRWISCPASIRMTSLVSAPVENVTSPYAAEGTLAHSVAEVTARYEVLKELTKREWNAEVARLTKDLDDDDRVDMIRHAREYAALLKDRLKVHPHSKLLLEQRLPTGIDQCWGTSDAVIVSPEHVEVVDYKYGLGIMVWAEDNSQLKLYAVGALDEYGDLLGETRLVRLTIHQPRLDHISSWDLSPDDLRRWRDEVAVVAAEALSDDAHFGPSEEACRFCPAAGECRARMEAATSVDFAHDPDLLSLDEIGELLAEIPAIRRFCDAVEATALRKMYSESLHVPGWKVVRSGGRRAIKDTEAALEALHAVGYKTEEVATVKLRAMGELSRLLGKEQFEAVLGSLMVKGEGSPSLAPETDKRPSITPNTEAKKEFSDE